MESEQARSLMIEMARAWTRLADEQDIRVLLPTADGSKPVLQRQQQQIQPNNDHDTS
jgi:hypothetical protein